MQTRGEIIRQRQPTRRETLEIAIFPEVSFRLIHSIHLYSEKQKYTRYADVSLLAPEKALSSITMIDLSLSSGRKCCQLLFKYLSNVKHQEFSSGKVLPCLVKE
jgi:hypothetical protein